MIPISIPSVSGHLSLEQIVAQLKVSPLVDGIATFGSHAFHDSNPASDFDLLILVHELPARVFQMITTIDDRLADIMLIEIELVDSLLVTSTAPKPRSFEALVVQKVGDASILYDASQRFQKLQKSVEYSKGSNVQQANVSEPELYAIWFWQGFGLLHLERMVQSANPTHLAALDMMLTACLSGTWRSYFPIRDLPWQGEKAAIRYWEDHDPEYLQAVRECIATHDRAMKITKYRTLVEQTIKPLGAVLKRGETAVLLADPTKSIAEVQRTVEYWDSLFNEKK